MKKQHFGFDVIGKTTDGKEVVSNVFRCYGTMGIPLFLILFILKEHNKIPDWIRFYQDAKQDGWNKKTILSKLRDEIPQIYSDEFSNIVVERLDKMFPDDIRQKGRIFSEAS